MEAKRSKPMLRKKSKPIMEYDNRHERLSVKSAVLILLAAAVTAALLYKLGTILLAGQSRTLHQPKTIRKQISRRGPILVHPWCPNPCYTIGQAPKQGCNELKQSKDEPPVSVFPASFWMVNTFQTGSSSIAGMFRSISAQYGIVPLSAEATKTDGSISVTKLVEAFQSAKTMSATDSPVSIVTHLPYTESIFEAFRDTVVKPPRPLLFTVISDPVRRMYSSYVQDACMRVARDELGDAYLDQCGENLTGDPKYIEKAIANDTEASIWPFIKTHPKEVNYNFLRGNAKSPKEVLDRFDFVFIAERLEESLAVFMLEFGLEWRDIAHIAPKAYTGPRSNADDLPQGIKSFVDESNKDEHAFWLLANKLLDEKIEALGRRCGGKLLPATLNTLSQLQQRVAADCRDFKGWYNRYGFAYPYTHFGDQGLGPRCVRHSVGMFLHAI